MRGSGRFRTAPLRGVYARNRVYAGVTGWESFEPWLSRMEAMAAETLWEIAEEVPPEWYGGDTGGDRAADGAAAGAAGARCGS